MTILHPLHYAVESLKVLPNEATNTRILGVHLVRSVCLNIMGRWALDWHIVDIRNSRMRYLGLQDVGNIVVKDRYRVGPTHGKCNKSMRAERRLESGVIAGSFVQGPFIIPDVQI